MRHAQRAGRTFLTSAATFASGTSAASTSSSVAPLYTFVHVDRVARAVNRAGIQDGRVRGEPKAAERLRPDPSAFQERAGLHPQGVRLAGGDLHPHQVAPRVRTGAVDDGPAGPGRADLRLVVGACTDRPRVDLMSAGVTAPHVDDCAAATEVDAMNTAAARITAMRTTSVAAPTRRRSPRPIAPLAVVFGLAKISKPAAGGAGPNSTATGRW